MYENHFGFTGRPFSIAPDPRFLFMSARHREALAHLVYGVSEGGGFVQLTGEVGTGKTTICRCLLEQLPENVDIALILNPRVTAHELISTLCDELRIDYPKDISSSKPLVDALNTYLLDAHTRGRRTVMIIDEAQNLDVEALEQVRLLTNLETNTEKLLQIILIGQPELRELLARDDLRQLSQRITARYHLEPIDAKDTQAYINHRLNIVGGRPDIFSSDAVAYIQSLSHGVPRIINVLCDRALLGAYVEGQRRVTLPTAKLAAEEVLADFVKPSSSGPVSLKWLLAGLAFPLLLFLLFWQKETIIRLAGFNMPAAKPQIIESSESTNRSPEKLAAQNKEITQPETAIVTTVVDNTVTPLTEKVEQIAKRPESQVTPTLSKLLDSATEEVTMNAWTGLFRRWGFDSNAKSEALSCSQASRVGLQCLKGSGSWKSITRYNRPVILVMTASNARPVPVLLERVDKNVATVMIDEERMTVSAAEIQQHWLGKFRLLWQLPPGGHSVLRPGERNADVQWLREQLQKEVGESELTASSSFYSFRVKKLLRQFQINRGLSADGIAGPETLIFINSIDAENTKIPLLMADSSNLNKGEN